MVTYMCNSEGNLRIACDPLYENTCGGIRERNKRCYTVTEVELFYTSMKCCILIGHLQVSKSLIPLVIQLIPPVTEILFIIQDAQ